MFHFSFTRCLLLFSFRWMDPYDILKISPQSTLSQIKKAYYLLAKVYHPDKNTENEQNYDSFLELKKAFELLSNNQERHIIDCYRLTQDAVIQDEITFEDLEYENGIFFAECRCGGLYELNALDLTTVKLQKMTETSSSFFAYCDSCSGACEIVSSQ